MAKSKIYSTPVIQNKKARFNYEFIDLYIAGIVLTGTEIKSIRAGKASIVDSYCYISNNEIFLKNSYVALYELGTYNNHEPHRDRKLLLNKKEISKLSRETESSGMTIVPVKMFINEQGYCKVQIALARGKKVYDKRESIKEKDLKREMERKM